jgi:hypothetical protein
MHLLYERGPQSDWMSRGLQALTLLSDSAAARPANLANCLSRLKLAVNLTRMDCPLPIGTKSL